VQFCWTFKELGRVGVAVVVTAVLVALVLQDMALACSMACSIACMYVAFFIFHLLVSVSFCRRVACSSSRLLSAVLFGGASSVRA
jgi:ABC-type cobalamin transport system permease subunit